MKGHTPRVMERGKDCCSTVVGLSFLRFTTTSHSAGEIFHGGSSSVCKQRTVLP